MKNCLGRRVCPTSSSTFDASSKRLQRRFVWLLSDCKKWVCLLVLAVLSISHAGSYDDFFVAIKRDQPELVKALLEKGFDANTLGPNAMHGLFLALREPSPFVAEVLIKWPKTQVDVRNANDETPLMMAALKGQLEAVQWLLARSADVNKPGWTALHYAATNGHLKVMQLLLDQHAYIDAESPNGSTPLMMAAHYGTPAAVKLLLDAGADASLKNQLQLSAIDFAVRANRKDVADLIAATLRARQKRGSW